MVTSEGTVTYACTHSQVHASVPAKLGNLHIGQHPSLQPRAFAWGWGRRSGIDILAMLFFFPASPSTAIFFF